MNIKNYLQKNLVAGLKKLPVSFPLKSIYLLPFYIVFSLSIGFYSEILKYNPLNSGIVIYLPFTLMVFPSIVEEILFRGLLIPIDIANKGRRQIVYYISISTILFVLWHPLNAVINPVSAVFFLNPYFLVIVALLGVTCSVSYIYSKSLWVPIIIHWLTVLMWVLLLGGRNLIIDG